MNIGLDYDNTFTRDPNFWLTMIDHACMEPFLQNHFLSKEIKETLHFCLDTWGVPTKVGHSLRTLQLTTVVQPWVANVIETSASVSNVAQDFGAISIRKKQIILLN